MKRGGHARADAGGSKTSNVMNVSKFPANGWNSFNVMKVSSRRKGKGEKRQKIAMAVELSGSGI